MPKCNRVSRPGHMKTIKTMKTGHSACLLTVSPGSLRSIMRSARSCLACQSNFRFIGFGAVYPPVFRFSHDPAGASDRFIHAFLLSFLFGKQPTRHLPKLLVSVAEIDSLNGLNGVRRSSLRVLRPTLLLFFAPCRAPIWASRKQEFCLQVLYVCKNRRLTG